MPVWEPAPVRICSMGIRHRPRLLRLTLLLRARSALRWNVGAHIKDDLAVLKFYAELGADQNIHLCLWRNNPRTDGFIHLERSAFVREYPTGIHDALLLYTEDVVQVHYAFRFEKHVVTGLRLNCKLAVVGIDIAF